MELKIWLKGLDHYLENIKQLRDDGLLLMDNGSLGHAYFSFFTALEESAMISYIIKSLYTPNPVALRKFLKHKLKVPYAIFRALKGDFSFDKTDEEVKKLFLNQRTSSLGMELKPDEFTETFEFKAGEIIEKKKKMWKLRNMGIYVGINKNNKRWTTPNEVKIGDIEFILKGLNQRIEVLEEVITSIHEEN